MKQKTISITFLALAATFSNAQWTANDIHPNGHTNSIAGGTDGSKVYGSIVDGGAMTGGYFSNGTFTSMQPNGATDCGFSAFDNGKQYGTAVIGGNGHAGVWSGNSASYQDWSPNGSTDSYIYTSLNGKAGGYARFGGSNRATLWSGGGANDITDYHNSSWLNSAIDAMDGSDIFGDYQDATGGHTVKWSNGPGSAVDLSPINSSDSQIIGASAGRQSGWANYGSGYNATMWSGTSASAININPLGFDESIAYGVRGLGASGTAWKNNVSHAGYWDLNTNTFVDLQQFVAPNFSASAAYSMEVINGVTNIYGVAWDTQKEVYHAMVWTQTVPEPCLLIVVATGLGAMARRRRRNF